MIHGDAELLEYSGPMHMTSDFLISANYSVIYRMVSEFSKLLSYYLSGP